MVLKRLMFQSQEGNDEYLIFIREIEGERSDEVGVKVRVPYYLLT